MVGLSRFQNTFSETDAAILLDREENLKDQIKSAYWFITNPNDSVFVSILLKNSINYCQKISPYRLVQIRWLSHFLLILLFVFSLIVAGTFNLQLSTNVSAKIFPISSDVSINTIDTDALEESNLALVEIGKKLKILEDDYLIPEDSDQLQKDLKVINDSVNMRAILARDGIEELAKALEARPEYEKIVSALRSERLDEALSMITEATGNLDYISDRTGSKGGEVGSALTDKEFLKNIDEISSDLANWSTTVSEEALEQALQSIEDAQSMLDDQEEARQQTNRMNTMAAPPDQLSPLTAARFGDQANPTEPQGSADPSGSTNMQGGTMFRQGAVARGDSDQDSDSGHVAGAASGDSEAAALEGGVTPRIKVNLELETLRINDGENDGRTDGEKSWFYSPSQNQEQSDDEFTDLARRQRYNAAEALDQQETPIRQRQIIRDYFINIHKKGEI